MHNVHILSTILIVSIYLPQVIIIINIIYSWHYAHISQNYIQPGSSKKNPHFSKVRATTGGMYIIHYLYISSFLQVCF